MMESEMEKFLKITLQNLNINTFKINEDMNETDIDYYLNFIDNKVQKIKDRIKETDTKIKQLSETSNLIKADINSDKLNGANKINESKKINENLNNYNKEVDSLIQKISKDDLDDKKFFNELFAKISYKPKNNNIDSNNNDVENSINNIPINNNSIFNRDDRNNNLKKSDIIKEDNKIEEKKEEDKKFLEKKTNPSKIKEIKLQKYLISLKRLSSKEEFLEYLDLLIYDINKNELINKKVKWDKSSKSNFVKLLFPMTDYKLVNVNNSLYIIGGKNYNNESLNAFFKIEISKGSINLTAPIKENNKGTYFKRTDHSVVYSEKYHIILICGGKNTLTCEYFKLKDNSIYKINKELNKIIEKGTLFILNDDYLYFFQVLEFPLQNYCECLNLKQVIKKNEIGKWDKINIKGDKNKLISKINFGVLNIIEKNNEKILILGGKKINREEENSKDLIYRITCNKNELNIKCSKKNYEVIENMYLYGLNKYSFLDNQNFTILYLDNNENSCYPCNFSENDKLIKCNYFNCSIEEKFLDED